MADKLRHIPPNDDELPSKPSAEDLLATSGGIERASPELLTLMAQKRDITFAEPGSELERYLNSIPAEASVSIGETDGIILDKTQARQLY